MNQKRSLITRRRFLKGAAGAIIGAGLAGCGQPTPAPPPTSAPTSGPFVPSLRILWTGDTHGHLTPAYHREPFGESFLKENGIERRLWSPKNAPPCRRSCSTRATPGMARRLRC
ncbi:MAG: twin-arginine translocation signal domain-containing protein [Chloroflexi bacterium]|nr:twin-arginine translocation signal domain-containing protein [Chloroflexota bacterium]